MKERASHLHMDGKRCVRVYAAPEFCDYCQASEHERALAQLQLKKPEPRLRISVPVSFTWD